MVLPKQLVSFLNRAGHKPFYDFEHVVDHGFDDVLFVGALNRACEVVACVVLNCNPHVFGIRLFPHVGIRGCPNTTFALQFSCLINHVGSRTRHQTQYCFLQDDWWQKHVQSLAFLVGTTCLQHFAKRVKPLCAVLTTVFEFESFVR